MSQIERILKRGNRVSMDHGVLSVTLTNGEPVKPSKLQEHEGSMVAEIAHKLGMEPLAYVGFSTGKFGSNGYPGVHLQFETLNGEDRYVIFNVVLKRSRNSSKAKAGSRYPGKQFAVSRGSHFYKFWTRTGIRHPKSLTVYHDYMGHLKGRYFMAELSGGVRLNAGSIMPITVSHDKLMSCFLPDNVRTSSGQATDNIRITQPDKDFAPSQYQQGFQPVSTTGEQCHGISKQGDAVQGMPNYIDITRRVQAQTTDEWLDDYSGSS